MTAINDDGEFEKDLNETYLPVLELEKENASPFEASYVYVDIKTLDKMFTLRLHLKPGLFPLSILRILYLSSNVPSKIFYASLGAEALRRNSNLNTFKSSGKAHISGTIVQRASFKSLEQCLCKVNGRSFDIFVTVADTYKKFRNCFLPKKLDQFSM